MARSLSYQRESSDPIFTESPNQIEQQIAEPIAWESLYGDNLPDSPDTRKPYRETAIEARRLGWDCPLPTRASSSPNPKQPAVKYADCYHNGLSHRKLAKLIHDFGDRNTTALVPPGLVVLDLDAPMPGHPHMPPTPTVLTRRGTHSIYRDKWGFAKKGAVVIDGRKIADILPRSAPPIVYPGSHIRGHTYKWMIAPPGANTGAPVEEFADCPEWIYEAYVNAQTDKPRVAIPAETIIADDFAWDVLQESWMADSTAPAHVTCADDLLKLIARRDVLARVMTFLGLNLSQQRLSKTFHCIMHDEKNPSASLFLMHNGAVMYRDWHHRDSMSGQPIEWYSLPEVWISRQKGSPFKFNQSDGGYGGTSHLIWTVRLLIESGVLKCAPPNLRTWTGTPEHIQYVADQMAYLFACHWLICPGNPAPFSYRFARLWCGVSDETTEQAIKILQNQKVIQIVGTCKSKWGKGTRLFMPVFRDAG